MDPRFAVIEKRLAGVRRIAAVTGGKGGIGKSLVATATALLLAAEERRVGLLDLDFTGPSDHVILGCDPGFPEEEFGIEPWDAGGVRFMSLSCFSGGAPTPLRGADTTNAFLELLAITRWGELDALVIDMPPGLGDATLDVIRLIDRAEYLFVATSSPLVLATVRKTLRLHTDLGTRVAGVVENMSRDGSPSVRDLAGSFQLPFLGSLPFDRDIEAALGDPERITATRFALALRDVRDALFPKPR